MEGHRREHLRKSVTFVLALVAIDAGNNNKQELDPLTQADMSLLFTKAASLGRRFTRFHFSTHVSVMRKVLPNVTECIIFYLDH